MTTKTTNKSLNKGITNSLGFPLPMPSFSIGSSFFN